MTDEFQTPTRLRVHLLYAVSIIALVAAIALMFSRYPLECGSGLHVETTWLTQFCARDHAAE